MGASDLCWTQKPSLAEDAGDNMIFQSGKQKKRNLDASRFCKSYSDGNCRDGGCYRAQGLRQNQGFDLHPWTAHSAVLTFGAHTRTDTGAEASAGPFGPHTGAGT